MPELDIANACTIAATTISGVAVMGLGLVFLLAWLPNASARRLVGCAPEPNDGSAVPAGANRSLACDDTPDAQPNPLGHGRSGILRARAFKGGEGVFERAPEAP